jgi:thermolabile hemolysin
MSKNGHRALFATFASACAVICASASASELPSTVSLHATTKADVRCHFTYKADPLGTKTAYVDAGVELKGYWHSASVLKSRSMFFTNASPADVRTACSRRIADIPEADGLAMISASKGSLGNNYEIWHNGDQARGKPIERIVSFGDSLSDSRNMYNESQWQLPSKSWYAGRFSNGPTWVEHLATRTGLTLNNWAVGGAQTKDARGGLIHGVGKQIDGFFNYMEHASDYDPSRTLFTFLIGGNDFVNDTKTPGEIVFNQEKALERLVARGARRILIVNLPDMSVAPVFTMKGGRTDADDILDKVDYYNARIHEVATRVAAGTKGTEISVADARKNFDTVLATPAKFGFTNAKESCLQIDSPSALGYLKSQKPRTGCQDPAKYVFWDTLHPTTRIHDMMAQWAIEATPATWGLRK